LEEYIQVEIDTKFIKLQQLIKLANFVSQGSDAKLIILEGKVKVNGEVILQRGKKIFAGDFVEAENFGSIKVVNGKNT